MNNGVTVDAPGRLCFNHPVETVAYIALGSNLGDRELNLLRAVAEVGKLPESRVTALSSFYETSPVGAVAQNAFYNAVLRLSTRLDARTLLHRMLQIEDEAFRRIRTIPQGPRTIDLDLLLYGDSVIAEENLVVPHPRLTERRFVLQPFCEIAPEVIHPLTGKTVCEHLASLNSNETVVKL
ncbi:MAG: 2-amino-4-hydroxy-6-hydroxymethyldihydropteridine diphosphokinase [Desulfuromonadales bacterium]